MIDVLHFFQWIKKLIKKFDLTDCKQYRDFIHIDNRKGIHKVMISKKILKIHFKCSHQKKHSLRKIVEFIMLIMLNASIKDKNPVIFLSIDGKIKYSSKNYNKLN